MVFVLRRIAICLVIGWLTGPNRLPPISGPRELLLLHGMQESQFRGFFDGQPIGAGERDSLLRMLYAVRRFSLLDIHRWKLRTSDWRQFRQALSEHRGDILDLTGKVTHVSLEKPLPELIERFEMPHFYRCEVLLGKDSEPATVYALKIPRAWKLDESLDARASFSGFFIKLGGEGEKPHPIFVTQRVAWHPATLLGELDMDVGLFDEVRPKGALSQSAPGAEQEYSDRECFYQLLAAAERASQSVLETRTADKVFDATGLVKKPEEHAGELVAFDGLARRAILVRVEDPDIVERLGIDHYYEIEVSVYLEHTLDGEKFNYLPMAFCVRELPLGMPTGERIAENVRIPAFFLKVWTYRSQASLEKGPDRRQIAPLFIGREPIWMRQEPARSTIWAAVGGALFVVAIVAIWVIVWRINRADDEFHRRILARQVARAPLASPDDPRTPGSADNLRTADTIEQKSDGPDFDGLP